MIDLVSLQLVNNFLLDYHLGHAILVGFALSVVGTIPLSRKVFSINIALFGLIFLLLPASMGSIGYKLFGLALLVVGTMLYTILSD